MCPCAQGLNWDLPGKIRDAEVAVLLGESLEEAGGEEVVEEGGGSPVSKAVRIGGDEERGSGALPAGDSASVDIDEGEETHLLAASKDREEEAPDTADAAGAAGAASLADIGKRGEEEEEGGLRSAASHLRGIYLRLVSSREGLD